MGLTAARTGAESKVSERRRRSAERDRDYAFEKQRRRAARTGTTPKALADAVARQGSGFLGTALMSRHSQRERAASINPRLLPQDGWTALAMVPLGDAALCRLGCGWPLAPDVWGRTSWTEHLRWGLDGVADTARMLRMGNTFGAAVLVRAQLERWTHNVAHHHRIKEVEGEGTADYFRRVWAVYQPLAEDLDFGRAWIELSEVIHGRGPVMRALHAATNCDGTLLDVRPVPEQVVAHEWLATLFRPIVKQVNGGISVACEEAGLITVASALQGWIQPLDEAVDVNPLFALAPLDFGVSTGAGMHRLVKEAVRYRRSVAASMNLKNLTTGSNRYATNAALIERRARAGERARAAFADEAEALGEQFEPGSLGARLFRYIAISEGASVVAAWDEGPSRDALVTASHALRAAWVLWLEDTDLSLPCSRTVLEQTCRARAWRTKPARAARVEAVGAVVAPIRWVEAAGWGRLSALSRALGEFSHVNVRARWSGAREVITAVQPQSEQDIRTARGHVLDSAAYLLADEVLARLDSVAPHLSEAFRDAVTLLSQGEHTDRTENLLERSLGLRGTSLGAPDLQPLEEVDR